MERKHHTNRGFLPATVASSVPSRPSNFLDDPFLSTLESSFSRLNIAQNDQLLYPANRFDDPWAQDFPAAGSVASSGGPFSGYDSQNRDFGESFGLPSLGFQDHLGGSSPMNNMYGYGYPYGLRDPLVTPGSYRTQNFYGPALKRNGLSSADPRRFGAQQESNRGGVSHRNQNVIRRPPQWFQEPVNCLSDLSVEELRGNVVAFAKHQNGCKILQKMIGDENKDQIFMEVINNVGELMLDPFGNYVVQRLAEVCTDEQRTQILLMLTQNEFQLVSLCLNQHGTRAVKKLMEHLTNPQQITILMSALSPGAVALTKEVNGHHIIQHCLKHFSEEDNKHLLAQVTNNCLTIARDKGGCCILQNCVLNSQGEARDMLVAEIIENALLLSEDRFGNYVVQYLLSLRLPQVTANLLRQLEGRYTLLSCNKYGSNVVERCMAESSELQSAQIIVELISNPNVSMLLVNPFGNYVIQSALKYSKGQVHSTLVALIGINIPMIRSNMYGKKVIEKMNKMLQQKPSVWEVF
ncbi:hypothetical protein Tsubulata_023849 [Turnera subulata]|uniref:PUM-HD domain-containing protein n=1 Tax=Turnera subulata TaxID=218843 RepID=A0A9Q0FRJ5_9ROSI|nr:hypothetical protein Tsubulata_023849 [Turnera subulata]